MVLKREVVEARLEELDRTLERLARHRETSLEGYRSDEDLQWIVERGLLSAAGLAFDVADHILSGHFGRHTGTYQASLDGLRAQGAISPDLHDDLRGLGGFRNILVHEYLEIDPAEVHRHFRKAFDVFPRFAREVLDWLERTDGTKET